MFPMLNRHLHAPLTARDAHRKGTAVAQPASAPTPGTPGRIWRNDESTRQALLAEVHRTRSRAAQLEKEAAAGATSVPLLRARRAALQALENYSAALSLHGWPTPRRMVCDIQLLRSLCASRRPHWDR